jgi:hypothetical protein
MTLWRAHIATMRLSAVKKAKNTLYKAKKYPEPGYFFAIS